MQKKKGFTIIEILVVIVILALLMVIAVPSIMRMSGRMKDRGLTSKLEAIKDAAVNYTQGHSNQIKSQILKENPGQTACTRSVARTFDSATNTYYANNSKGKRWCECANNTAGTSTTSDDCKFVFEMTVDELIEKGAYKSEQTGTGGSSCDVTDPTREDRCLDCLRITIKLDDDYKSADAYVSDDDISALTDKNTCD